MPYMDTCHESVVTVLPVQVGTLDPVADFCRLIGRKDANFVEGDMMYEWCDGIVRYCVLCRSPDTACRM